MIALTTSSSVCFFSCRRWAAATGAATLALLGASPAPSHAFLATSTVRSGRWTQQRIGGDLRTSMTPVALASPTKQPPSTARAVPAEPDVSAEGERTSGRRWIKDVKSGDKVIGYVSDTTVFAAFIDVGVVRKGSQGKVVPVHGFLHSSDIRGPYALEKTNRAKTCEVKVKKGIHLTAYVKDVFPNAGRLTLCLDPSINRNKVLKMRGMMRKRSRIARRGRLAEKNIVPQIGDVTEGYVQRVQQNWLLVDVMHPEVSVLRIENILSVIGGEDLELKETVKAGERITVRVTDIVSGKPKKGDVHRRADGKAILDFVRWGGIDQQDTLVQDFVADRESAAAQDVDMVSSFADANDEEMETRNEQQNETREEDEGENVGVVVENDHETGDGEDREQGEKKTDL